VAAPNDLWTADFKGWWRTRDGARCEPLTVRDAHSRFVLELQVLRTTEEAPVRQAFEGLFERYGLPTAIQTDNGRPFAWTGALGGLTRLSAWWVSLGIRLVRSRPGCPQDNGAHERMHADIRFEIEDKATRSLRTQQLACDDWVTEFNHVRPHDALGLRTPAEVYQPSKRKPNRIIVGGFPDDCEIHRVGNQGRLRYQGQTIFVSCALEGHQVGFQHGQGDDVLVWFYDLLLGKLLPDRRAYCSVQPFPFESVHHVFPSGSHHPAPEGGEIPKGSLAPEGQG
jgi:hypothetical protein